MTWAWRIWRSKWMKITKQDIIKNDLVTPLIGSKCNRRWLMITPFLRQPLFPSFLRRSAASGTAPSSPATTEATTQRCRTQWRTSGETSCRDRRRTKRATGPVWRGGSSSCALELREVTRRCWVSTRFTRLGRVIMQDTRGKIPYGSSRGSQSPPRSRSGEPQSPA